MKKFIVLSTQRSGSTYFRVYLNQHPNLKVHDEVLLDSYLAPDGFRYYCKKSFIRKLIWEIKEKRLLRPKKYLFMYNRLEKTFLDRLFTDNNLSEPWDTTINWHDLHKLRKKEVLGIGFKLMYDQLELRKIKNYILDNNIQIVHLIRSNLLKMLISREMLALRDKAHYIKGENCKPISITLDPSNVIEILEKFSEQQRRHRKFCSSISSLEIIYENFCINPIKELKIITEFFGINYYELGTTSFKKQNSDNLKKILKNYSEIAEVLKNTRFQSYL